MKRESIIATLLAHEPKLRQLGVSHAALFGSIARDDGRAASDIDIMIELAPDRNVGVFEYVGITQYIADLFPMPVDVVNRGRMKPNVRPSAERDAVYAF
jgi:predicted nucleotidyltransferase